MNAGEAKGAIQELLGVKPDKDFGPITSGRFAQLAVTGNGVPWPPPSGGAPELLTVIGGIRVFIDRVANLVFWDSGATIDVDGAPDAYHPDDHSGRDALAAAGRPGNWWGIVTDTDHLEGKAGKGTPYVQGRTCRAFSPATVGFYVSSTAYADNPEFPISDVRRYCNPDEIPGFVVPLKFPVKIRMGTKGRVTFNGRTEEAFAFDLGPPDHIGEIGTLLAKRLGIPASPRTGGVAQKGVRFEIPLI